MRPRDKATRDPSNSRRFALETNFSHMKFTSLKPSLAVVAPLLALSLGTAHLACAQPAGGVNGAPKTGKRGRKAKSGISPKLLASIEAKTGKPVTPEQKTQLDAASDTHRAAVKAADARYRSDMARILGLSEADAKSLGRKPKAAKMVMPKA